MHYSMVPVAFWVLTVCMCCCLADRGRLRFSNKARMQLDLRRTLWFWKLGSVLVFETQRHLLEFKQRLNSRDKTLER